MFKGLMYFQSNFNYVQNTFMCRFPNIYVYFVELDFMTQAIS